MSSSDNSSISNGDCSLNVSSVAIVDSNSDGPSDEFVESALNKCEKFRRVTLENEKKKSEGYEKLRREFKSEDVNALIASAKDEIQKMVEDNSKKS
jgi:hypothetical protein